MDFTHAVLSKKKKKMKPGKETPRQGIGNQDQGHPAAHGAFNSQFDPDDAANEAEQCTT